MIPINVSKQHMDNLYIDFGKDIMVHTDLLIEESSELTKELSKLNRYLRAISSNNNKPEENLQFVDNTRRNIAEEMAHVYVCMEAVKELVGISNTSIQEEIYRKEGK